MRSTVNFGNYNIHLAIYMSISHSYIIIYLYLYYYLYTHHVILFSVILEQLTVYITFTSSFYKLQMNNIVRLMTLQNQLQRHALCCPWQKHYLGLSARRSLHEMGNVPYLWSTKNLLFSINWRHSTIQIVSQRRCPESKEYNYIDVFDYTLLEYEFGNVSRPFLIPQE